MQRCMLEEDRSNLTSPLLITLLATFVPTMILIQDGTPEKAGLTLGSSL